MEERLTPEIEAAAYRIVQEALTNVAKHARATICRVYLQRLPNTVLITIEDDGVGIRSGGRRRARRRTAASASSASASARRSCAGPAS